MKTRKITVLLLAVIIAMSFTACAFAASGEGYFGSDKSVNVIPDVDDDYEPSAPAQTQPQPQTQTQTNQQQRPVLPPMPTEEELNSRQTPSNVPTAPNRTAKAVADKREKNSEDTAKVIRSYGLDPTSTNFFIARHNDAAKGQGNREKADRYQAILNTNPEDYLAAYRLAQVNLDMGRNSQALGWVNKCLEIYPNYMPARRLKTQIEGRLK